MISLCLVTFSWTCWIMSESSQITAEGEIVFIGESNGFCSYKMKTGSGWKYFIVQGDNKIPLN